MTASPAARAAAAELEHLASLVRERQRRLAAASATPEWEGPAARAFRRRVHTTVEELAAAARHLDGTADALRRHAASVERREHELEDLAGVALTGLAGLL